MTRIIRLMEVQHPEVHAPVLNQSDHEVDSVVERHRFVIRGLVIGRRLARYVDPSSRVEHGRAPTPGFLVGDPDGFAAVIPPPRLDSAFVERRVELGIVHPITYDEIDETARKLSSLLCSIFFSMECENMTLLF